MGGSCPEQSLLPRFSRPNSSCPADLFGLRPSSVPKSKGQLTEATRYGTHVRRPIDRVHLAIRAPDSDAVVRDIARARRLSSDDAAEFEQTVHVKLPNGNTTSSSVSGESSMRTYF